jgi:Tol biopolymer transport system component
VILTRDLGSVAVAAVILGAAIGTPATVLGQSTAVATPAVPMATTSSAPTAPTPTPRPSPTVIAAGEPWIAYEWVSPESGTLSAGIRLVRTDGTGDHWATPDAPIGGGADNGDGWQLSPDWSPDGNQLAFAVDDVGKSIGQRDIWVGNADVTNERRVFDCMDPCLAANNPSWSKDGSSLIFVDWDHVNHAVNGSRLESLDLASGSLQTLATTTGSDYFSFPRYSPDGLRVVVEIDHWSSTDDSSVFVNSWIAVVDLSTSPATVTRLTDPSMDANRPDWHPKEDLIIFVIGTPETGQPSDLYTIKPDGSDQTLFLHSDSRRLAEPSWLPDGSGLIYVGVTGPGFDDPRMYTVAADGTGASSATADDPQHGSHPRMRPVPAG